MVTRSKEGWGGSLPLSYADQIRELSGVRQACASRWAGLRVPGKENLFFQSMGTEVAPFLAMHDELESPAEQRQAFLENESSIYVSMLLAAELGWKLGDRIVSEYDLLDKAFDRVDLLYLTGFR